MSSLLIQNTMHEQNTLNNQSPLVNINNPEEDIPSTLCNCNVFYTSPSFNNLCSGCFADKYPTEYEKIMDKPGIKVKYRLKELDEQIKEYKISRRNGFLKGIELILDNYNKVGEAEKKNAYSNVCKLLHQIIKLNKGLTTEQASKIYIKFKGILGNREDWHLQHLMCGFIVDPWNITPEKCGGVGYCYYGYNNIPYKEEFKEIPLTPVIYHNIIQEKPSIILKASYDYQGLNDAQRSQYESYKMWIRSMPDEFKYILFQRISTPGNWPTTVFNKFKGSLQQLLE
tara:strand:- start:6559 stop:7410 length:852 start_codon:yes stop_codon:yes gene_type:complete